MMYLLLGTQKNSDGVRMLRLILSRYGVTMGYRMDFCYPAPPPSKAIDRANLIAERREWLEAIWTEQPGVIIGLGWMACELLTGRGKTKLKNMTGTKWMYMGSIVRQAWITYDPDACLYDPALVVDISAVIVAAGKEVGYTMNVSKNEALQNMNTIWKRYL